MKVTLGQYLPLSSVVHAADPRVKIFLMALGIGTAFQVDTFYGLGIFSLSCMLLTAFSKVPPRKLFAGLTPFLWLFLFTALLHVFMTPGDPISEVPYATRQGLESGIRVGFQLIFAIWLSTLMTLTTSPLDMVWALEWFMTPLKYLKVPIDEIALLVMLAIRFIPLLFEETDRIIKAQKSRGVDIESGGMIRKVKALIPILVPLLYGVFRRADDLAIALTLRGYSPGIKRTRMKQIRAASSDYIALVGISVLMVCLISL
ncbi:MAG TPA: energy-coupling factor transporter transmembrane protein EcfT [Deltaproteobacteria bacterium]|nr:energy-coupling factor transporter transmembrane protein EcfT [Deltaproteobacteria bacterium]